ncbi:helix-turn-helix domain-containing protein [Paenibacillus aurantiacus]|uniref:Helix-turn-helix domain-containing protein n=1 Tax=Paenibacillus aurantiacus TaxID=1936118 RepID=A0ABV5KLR8_9BACL
MIGDRIKQLRERKGLTITELAVQAGVSKSYLSHIERKLQNNPSLQVLSKIAVPLDTKVQVLLGERDEGHQQAGDGRFAQEWMDLLRQVIAGEADQSEVVRISERIQAQTRRGAKPLDSLDNAAK